jgi:mannosyltransferase
VPFVGSDAGYYNAFSAQGKTGVVVAQGDAQAASEAARAILSDRIRHAAMAKSARMIAEKSFSAAAEAAGIEQVYQDVWAGR